MIAIYKREMRAYFTTPIGYIFLAFFLSVSALTFSLTTLYAQTTAVTGYFQVLLYGMIVLLPLLTMKLFSEERKQKTEQLLLTAPVTLWGMVMAKFLAAFSVYVGALTLTLFYFPILEIYGSVKLGMLFGNYFALLFAGAAMIAIGLFVSALTENQLTAAVGTIALLLLQVAFSLINSLLGDYWARFIVGSLSIFSRFQTFAQGIFDFSAVIYYLSFAAIFLFLTVAVFHRRRYE